MDETNKIAFVTQEEIKLSWQELTDKLLQEGKIEIKPEQTLTFKQMDISDFLALVEEPEASKKVTLFAEIMRRFFLEISLEGSIALGPFNLADQSWSMNCGNTGFMRITAKPLVLRQSLKDIVSFLTKIPVGQALVLKPRQNLFLDQISADAMFNYYQHCQDETDPVSREKGQDEMFIKSCPLLEEKNLLLKIYGLNTKQVDRAIDAAAGGMLFTPVESDEFKEPRIVLGLVAKP